MITYGFWGSAVAGDLVGVTFTVGLGVPDRLTSGVVSGVGTAPERASLNEANNLKPGVSLTFIVRVKNPGKRS